MTLLEFLMATTCLDADFQFSSNSDLSHCLHLYVLHFSDSNNNPDRYPEALCSGLRHTWSCIHQLVLNFFVLLIFHWYSHFGWPHSVDMFTIFSQILLQWKTCTQCYWAQVWLLTTWKPILKRWESEEGSQFYSRARTLENEGGYHPQSSI